MRDLQIACHRVGMHPQVDEAVGEARGGARRGAQQVGERSRRRAGNAARWCSCSIDASTDATSAGTRRALARAVIAATGFCLCGIADDPPAVFGDLPDLGGRQPPHIVGDLPISLPPRRRHRQAAPAGCDRCARARARAVARVRRRGRRPRRSRAGRARPGCPRPRRTAPAAPTPAATPGAGCGAAPTADAATAPNVVGNACWPSVRATIGVSRWVRARSAHARSRSGRSRAVPARSSSTRAVSRMSWLVAPRCTCAGGTSGCNAASADRSTDQRDHRVAAGHRRRAERGPGQARITGLAQDSDHRVDTGGRALRDHPHRGLRRASAASTVSRASTHDASPSTAAAPDAPKIGSKSSPRVPDTGLLRTVGDGCRVRFYQGGPGYSVKNGVSPEPASCTRSRRGSRRRYGPR